MRRRTALLLALACLAACGAERDDTVATSSEVSTTEPLTAPPLQTTVPPSTAVATESTDTTVAPTTTEPLLTPARGDLKTAIFADGFRHPLDMAWRPGDDVPYVVLREGLIVRARDGHAAETALDLTGTLSLTDVQGLLGLAFHPTQPLAYVHFNDRLGAVTIAEYKVRDNGTFDPESKRVLLSVEQEFPNHNGGQLAFGPDDYLYISIGDGSGGKDGLRHPLDLADLHGKILRIDPTPSTGSPYTVPGDNPFVGVDGARPEIWSYGLRNTWRFSFDGTTGDLWIGDVGESRWEEVNLARAVEGGGRGVSFGWSAFEGTRRYNSDQTSDAAVLPVYQYGHGDGDCAITGGAVYHGSTIPTLRRWYVFADYCSGNLWALHIEPGSEAQVIRLGRRGQPAALVAGPDGELYIVDYSGKVWLLAPA